MTSPAAFPESRFAAASDRQEEYRARVDRGRSVMRDKRVVICGVARDVAEILSATIARIERLGRMFAEYRVVVYENDSIDATREILSDWETANRRVTLLAESRGDPVNPVARCVARAERMAYYRNRYREVVNARFSDFDYAIVLDMDLHAGWSYDGLANTFGHEGWDFVGSYGLIERSYLTRTLLVQYDAWAFRAQGSYSRIPTKVVNHMRYSRGDPMLEVYSCFGGLGVYGIQAMLKCRYDGSDCEHVCFHRSMRDARLDRLFLNPSQITFYGKKANNLVRAYRRLTGANRRRAA
jgi:hypothetical protein